jgi:RimJ/RimL family protein N-acetyltransferase
VEPVVLRSPRLVLSIPTIDDVDAIAEYCQDPLFERYMTLPWPYRRSDASTFVTEIVPSGWASEREFTWALRRDENGELLGAVGSRVVDDGRLVVDVGYWLGAPNRGCGLMSEAVQTVIEWLFDRLNPSSILWECVAGNEASARVARHAGFAFTGIRPGRIAMRDGSHVSSWHAERTREPSGMPWPAEILASHE